MENSIKGFIRFLFWLSFFVIGCLSFSVYKNWKSYQDRTPPSIWFDDPLFELSLGSRLKDAELSEFVTLKAEGMMDFSLADLRKFTKMDYLEIQHVSNEMIQEIATYPSIYKLALTIDNRDLDLIPLQKLPKLRNLEISGVITEKQLKAIQQMDSLDRIVFKNVRMEKMPKFNDCSKLDSIMISNAIIYNLDWITCFDQLKWVFMNHTYMVSPNNFESIVNLGKLESISLNSIKIEDLSFINKLKNLDSLELNDIGTSDISVIRLEELPKLKEVKFDETIENENQEQIWAFREYLKD